VLTVDLTPVLNYEWIESATVLNFFPSLSVYALFNDEFPM